MYANSSVIDINLVGEGFEGARITDGGALECHTDDNTCCRRIDNPSNGTGGGEWYYPDGTVVPPPGGSIEGSTEQENTRLLDLIVMEWLDQQECTDVRYLGLEESPLPDL